MLDKDNFQLHITRVKSEHGMEVLAYIPYPESSLLTEPQGYCDIHLEHTFTHFKTLMDESKELTKLFGSFTTEGRLLIHDTAKDFVAGVVKNMHRFRLASGLLTNTERPGYAVSMLASVCVHPVTRILKIGVLLELNHKPLEMGPRHAVRHWNNQMHFGF